MMIDYEGLCREVKRRHLRYEGMSAAEICDRLDIYINRMHLGDSPDCIKGFITRNCRCYCITVNCDLPRRLREIVLFHELAHYFLGHLRNRVCTFEDRSFSYLETPSEPGYERARLENEANLFTADYLISDEEALALLASGDFYRTARRLRVPPAFLECKCRMLRHRGLLTADSPLLLSCDFLKDLKPEEIIDHDDC